MGLADYFSFGSKVTHCDIPTLWSMQLKSALYAEIQLRTMFGRILSEVITRSHTIPDDFRHLIRDSMEGEGHQGLIEHIVCAMANQTALVLKYEAGILHVPEYGDKSRIMDEWKKGVKPKNTLMLSFKNYHKTTILRQYLHHKYLLLCTQNKALNLSSAVQIKIDLLRQSVGMKDGDVAGEQAIKIANALLDGSPVLIDSKDAIELLAPDTSPLKEVAEDIQSEISLILGLPIAWIAGKQKVGLGDSGDADSRAIERGLEPYFWESIHPAFKLLFDITLKFKSERIENISLGLQALQTFTLSGDRLLSSENQARILSMLFDVEQDDSIPAEQAIEPGARDTDQEASDRRPGTQ